MPRISTGAPGIYFKPQEEKRGTDTIPMDVCGFVGVAPRGPVREVELPEGWTFERPSVGLGFSRRRSVAVPVESFDEYRRIFGGFEGPGRLPYAVASFFENGGRRAHVIRIVHDYGKDASGEEKEENFEAVASGTIPGAKAGTGDLTFLARSEGSWGNNLRAALGYSILPLNFTSAALIDITVAIHEPLSLGDLLLITLDSGMRLFRFVTALGTEPSPGGGAPLKVASFGLPLVSLPESIDVVHGVLTVDDGAGFREAHDGLGLSSLHCRWVGTVLCYESELVYPDASWVDGEILPADADDLFPENAVESVSLPQFTGGRDRYADIVSEDFFDPRWRLGHERPGDGIHAAAFLPDLSAMCVPDLYSPMPLVPEKTVENPVPLAGPDFVPCLDPAPPAEEQETVTDSLEGLRKDPLIPHELAEIVSLQQRVSNFAADTKGFVALLDVPPGLCAKQVKRWRRMFDTSFSAAYHPWLRVARGDDRREELILLPPSASAAGIIARREHLFGVPQGPANALVTGAVDMGGMVSREEHDDLHPLGINVYVREKGGIRLSAARTLTNDPAFRQLSVRRLIMMIIRTLERETHWMVFEPNGPELRAKVLYMLKTYLRQLYRMGAFRGESEEEAFFVRCDESLNPRRVTDAGKLIAMIGIAPSEPIEFIVLNLVREGDGTLVVTE